MAISPRVWREGNALRLLENGEAFFPRVMASIDAAEREVLIETFRLHDDEVGLLLKDALLRARQRGVAVQVTVDGYGSMALGTDYRNALTAAGVALVVFEPVTIAPRLNWIRRLHRKLVVIDGTTAFIGGINFCEAHLLRSGPEAMQDWAVQVTGPVVGDMHALMTARDTEPKGRLERWHRRWSRRTPSQPSLPVTAGTCRAMLVDRDNQHHRDAIEQHYLLAISRAQKRILIANAYFFPGIRLLRALRRAAQRGVRVQLMVQGCSDVPGMQLITASLYYFLARAKIAVFEYCERPIHAKLAVVDEDWATIGSSNLDPLSLALNLEANLLVEDTGFARQLYAELKPFVQDRCRPVDMQAERKPTLLRRALWFVAYRLAVWFPRVLGRLPARAPKYSLHGPSDSR